MCLDPGIGEQVARRALECMAITRVLQVEVALDPTAGVVGDRALVVKFADQPPLGLDKLRLQRGVFRDRTAVVILVFGATQFGEPVTVPPR